MELWTIITGTSMKETWFKKDQTKSLVRVKRCFPCLIKDNLRKRFYLRYSSLYSALTSHKTLPMLLNQFVLNDCMIFSYNLI